MGTYQLPVTSYQLSVISYQLSVISYQFFDFKFWMKGFWIDFFSAPNHQSPITNHQSPITNHQSPSHQLPMTNQR